MALTNVVGVVKVINSGDNGNTLVLGDASVESASTMMLHFVNDNAFSGTLIVQARGRGVPGTVALQPVQYLSIYVNGATGTNGYVSTTLTTTSIILVPATGMTIGLVVTCSSGSGTLYISRVAGAAA